MPNITKEQIRKRVVAVISEQMTEKPEKILDDTHLVEDLRSDSLDVVELVMALEEEFEIEIIDEDAEKMLTVKDILNHIEGKIG